MDQRSEYQRHNKTRVIVKSATLDRWGSAAVTLKQERDTHTPRKLTRREKADRKREKARKDALLAPDPVTVANMMGKPGLVQAEALAALGREVKES